MLFRSVSQSRYREGIKVPNKYNDGGVLSNVITEDRIQRLVDELRFVNVLQVSSQIIDIIKAA